MEPTELPEKIEPYRRNRWVLYIPGIDTFLVKGLQLPHLSAYSDDGFTSITVTFHNAIGHPINIPLVNMLRSGDTFTVTLRLLDEAGSVIDRWMMDEAHIDQIFFEGLSYDDDGPLMTHVVIMFPQHLLRIEQEG